MVQFARGIRELSVSSCRVENKKSVEPTTSVLRRDGASRLAPELGYHPSHLSAMSQGSGTSRGTTTNGQCAAVVLPNLRASLVRGHTRPLARALTLQPPASTEAPSLAVSASGAKLVARTARASWRAPQPARNAAPARAAHVRSSIRRRVLPYPGCAVHFSVREVKLPAW